MNIKEFRREMKSAQASVSASLKKCHELLWAVERDGLRGQERTDAEEAVRMVERLKCAKEILSLR